MSVRKIIHDPHGTVAILTALLLLVLLGFGAFAIDFGFAWVTNNQLQDAADAAALAGARAIGVVYCPATGCLSLASQQSVTVAGVQDQVTSAVQNVSSQNSAFGQTVAILPSDIQIGQWSNGTRTFSPNVSPPNAVAVTARRDTQANGPITTFLGVIFHVQSLSLSKRAIAALGYIGSASPGEVSAPFGISALNTCANPITFNATQSSCAAWTSFGQPFGGASDEVTLIQQMDAGTFQAPAICVGCPDNSGTNTFGDLNFKGGTMTSVWNAFQTMYNDHKDASGNWTIFIPVYQESGSCGNANPSGGAIPIVGFATMTITGMTTTGPNKSIQGNLVCGEVASGRGGGGNFGTLGSIPGLVQ